MKTSDRISTVMTYALLLGAAVVVFRMPASLPGAHAVQAVDETIVVTGIVYDFPSTHPDFNVTTTGHVANNVAFELDNDHRPTYTGSGFDVDQQWRDTSLRNIAPHMSRGGVLRLLKPPVLSTGSYMDTWDSAEGLYGGSNIGPAPAIVVGPTAFPTMSLPSDLGASVGDVTYPAGAVVTIDSDLYCDEFIPSKEFTGHISGDVTIVCRGDFILNQQSHMFLEDGATLTLYVGRGLKVSASSTLNMNTRDPSRCMIYNVGKSTIRISQDCKVAAHIVSPKAGIELAQQDELFGTFAGPTVTLDKGSAFHIDAPLSTNACGPPYADQPGAFGATETTSVKGPASFAGWYRASLGTNMTGLHRIELVNDGSGVYEFHDNSFYPVDDRLLGNEGRSHNYDFTYSLEVEFTYEQCGDQFFYFEGSDDAWLFVDDALGIDLGGVGPLVGQYVELDRMSLTDGEQYTMRLFYAHRSDGVPMFRLRTNVELGTRRVFMASEGFD